MVGTDHLIFALGLTLLAGLSTGIGGLLILKQRRNNVRFLAVAMGLSAGVMIYVSFMEFLVQAEEALTTAYGSATGTWLMIVAFFGGIAFIALIDKALPEAENPHEPDNAATLRAASYVADNDRPGHDREQETASEPKANPVCQPSHVALVRTGFLTALAIGIHNFPEGMATFMSSLSDPGLGITIAAAVALHNIPEGISVAVPIYFGGGGRRRAVRAAFLAGLAEPAGALVGALLLLPFLDDALMGAIFAAVAGIMVFISLDELLPSAQAYGEHHLSIYGLIGGMLIMAVSLQLLG